MISTFTEFPFFIQAVVLIILISTLGWIINGGVLLFSRWAGYTESRASKSSEPIFQQLFLRHVFLPEAEDTLPANLGHFREKYLSDKATRRRLVGDIIHYQKLFSGTIGERLIQLYNALGLDADARQALKSRKVTRLILALNELLHMEFRISDTEIEALLRHKHPLVREIARRYILKMVESDPFQVFTNLEEPLSAWEQIELFKVITAMDNRKIPNFALWIQDGQITSLVSLCLKLTVYFQQYESIPVITDLLHTGDARLREEAVNALGKLHQAQAEQAIVALYDQESESVKIEIVKALGRINSGQYLNLLKHVFDQETSISLRKHAARSIRSHRERGSQIWDTLRNSEVPLEQTLLSHASNQLLKY